MFSIEVWVVVDSQGDIGVGKDEDGACDDYADNVGGNNTRRCIRVLLEVPEPKIPTLVGIVPEETIEGASLTVA